MTESNDTTTPVAPVEQTDVVPSRMQQFWAKHPRAKKAAYVTVGLFAVGGVVQTARTVRANKDDVQSARENLGEAASDLASAVTPQSTED